MDQSDRNFKVFEIEEEEPDFSTTEKENLLSFADAISEELKDEGWLPNEEKSAEPEPETTSEPIAEDIEENSPEEDSPLEEDTDVPEIRLEKPAAPTVMDISDISDKLAFVMGLIPTLDVESESEPVSEVKSEPEQESVSQPESEIEPEMEPESEPEPAHEPEPELEPEPEQEQEQEQEPTTQSGPIDDEFYRYFGDLKLADIGISGDMIFSSDREQPSLHQLESEQTVSPEKSKKKKRKSTLKNILSWVLTIIIAFLIAMLINIYLFRPSEVSGPSMMPTLQNGDTVILSRVPYMFDEPRQGDIVVIDSNVTKNRNALTLFSEALEYNVITKLLGRAEPDYFWIKRVIGVAGDTISFEANRIYRNGEEIYETYINEQDVRTYKNGTSYTIEEGYVFVMGDNRNHSTDSRVIGPVPVDHIIGKMIANWS